MKYITLALSFFLLFSLKNLSAQYKFDRKDIATAFERDSAIFMLFPESEYVIKELKSEPEELKKYKSFIEEKNKMIRELVPPTIMDQFHVSFKTQDEINEMTKKESKKYIILYFVRNIHAPLLDIENHNATYAQPQFVTATFPYGGYQFKQDRALAGDSAERMLSTQMINSQLHVCLADNLGNSFAFATCRNYIPQGHDLVFGIDYISWFMKRINENNEWKMDDILHLDAAEVPKKILLIDEKDLGTGITEEEIAKFYDYPIEIVDHEKYSSLIIERNPKYNYFYISYKLRGDHTGWPVIVEAETGKILLINSWVVRHNNEFKAGVLTFQKIAEIIQKSQ